METQKDQETEGCEKDKENSMITLVRLPSIFLDSYTTHLLQILLYLINLRDFSVYDLLDHFIHLWLDGDIVGQGRA